MTDGVCGLPCEVYSRVVGYLRPVRNWNAGKKAEYSERVPFAGAKEITVDGDLMAEIAAQLLSHLCGHVSADTHTEADWLRLNGHDLAGEILEMVATARDSVMESHG